MNSVVVAEEWPQHLKLVPSNENVRNPNEYQYKPLCNARRLYFLRKNRHFYHIFNFNANFEANFFP